MEAFARLYAELDATTSTHAKLAALERYFRGADAADAAWAAYFLAGGRPRQLCPRSVLREVAVAAAGLPRWLFDECYDAVGDFAETVAHVLPPPSRTSDAGLAEWMSDRVLPLRGVDPETIADALARLLGRARCLRPLPVAEAARRQLSRRRVAAAGHARARGRIPASTRRSSRNG